MHADEPLVVPLGDNDGRGGGHGRRLSVELNEEPQLGGTRADGSKITAGVPDPIPAPEEAEYHETLPEPPPIGPHVPQS